MSNTGCRIFLVFFIQIWQFTFFLGGGVDYRVLRKRKSHQTRKLLGHRVMFVEQYLFSPKVRGWVNVVKWIFNENFILKIVFQIASQIMSFTSVSVLVLLAVASASANLEDYCKICRDHTMCRYQVGSKNYCKCPVTFVSAADSRA